MTIENITEIESVIAYIWSSDHASNESVLDTQVDLNIDTFTDKPHRESVREELESCFSAIWHQKAKALFSDEI